jgi:hypothetical protein
VTIPQLQGLAAGVDIDDLNLPAREIDAAKGAPPQRWPNRHPRYPDSVLVVIARLERIAGTQMRAPQSRRQRRPALHAFGLERGPALSPAPARRRGPDIDLMDVDEFVHVLLMLLR